MSGKQITERDIALKLVLNLATCKQQCYALSMCFDQDVDFVSNVASQLGVTLNDTFVNKLKVVTRTLVNKRVLCGQMVPAQNDLFNGQSKQMEYTFYNPAYYSRGTTVSGAELLIFRAYPPK